MNKYIFLTNEGYTYLPNSESIEADCENAQLLGIAEGINQEMALEELLKDNKYDGVDEIYCYKLDNDYEQTLKKFNIK